MYIITKYTNCWMVLDTVTGGTKSLNATEKERIKNEFKLISNPEVHGIQVEQIRSISTVTGTYPGN